MIFAAKIIWIVNAIIFFFMSLISLSHAETMYETCPSIEKAAIGAGFKPSKKTENIWVIKTEGGQFIVDDDREYCHFTLYAKVSKTRLGAIKFINGWNVDSVFGKAVDNGKNILLKHEILMSNADEKLLGFNLFLFDAVASEFSKDFNNRFPEKVKYF